MKGWRLLAAAIILAVAVIVAMDDRPGLSTGPGFWLLLAGFSAWYVGSVFIGRPRLHASLPVSLLYFAVGWVLWALLIERHAAANTFAGILFPLTYSMLPIRRAIGFGLVLAAIMFLAGSDWSPRLSVGLGIGVGLSVASSVMLALFINAISTLSEERRKLLEQLTAAREDLARAARVAGVMEERQRLALQIHDTVAQGFVGVVAHLEAAETTLDPSASKAAAHVAEAKAGARESLAEARRLVWDLRPDLRQGEPLGQVIARLADEWSRRSGVRASVDSAGMPRALDTDRESVLLQSVREALNNVRVHAGATAVSIRLSYSDDAVTLSIEDDGRGPGEPARSSGGGFGLRALEDRLRALGGQLMLRSGSPRGAVLTVSMPAQAPAS